MKELVIRAAARQEIVLGHNGSAAYTPAHGDEPALLVVRESDGWRITPDRETLGRSRLTRTSNTRTIDHQ